MNLELAAMVLGGHGRYSRGKGHRPFCQAIQRQGNGKYNMWRRANKDYNSRNNSAKDDNDRKEDMRRSSVIFYAQVKERNPLFLWISLEREAEK